MFVENQDGTMAYNTDLPPQEREIAGIESSFFKSLIGPEAVTEKQI